MIDIAAIILFLSTGKINESIIALVILVGIYAFQLTFRCPNCKARPALWLLAIWTILLDFHLYVADAILLNECPKCEIKFKEAYKKNT